MNMRATTREAADRAAVAVVGSISTWSLQSINEIIAALVGIVTFVFVIAQLMFLLRKWHVLERNKWFNGSNKIEVEETAEKQK